MKSTTLQEKQDQVRKWRRTLQNVDQVEHMANSRRPLRVYLDNSDLSDLYKGHTEELRETRQSLLEMAATGEARFYFSYWHVFEFLQPPPPEYVDEHRAKAKFLAELCGKNTLPYPADVMAQRHISEPGIWIPLAPVLAWKTEMNARLSKSLAEKIPLNRKQRRIAKTPKFSRGLFNKFDPLEPAMQAEFGLTDEFVKSEAFTKLMRGEITDRSFVAKFAQMFSDPPYFFEQWFINQGRGNILLQQFRDVGERLVKNVENLQEQSKVLLEKRKDLAVARKNIFKAKKRLQDLGMPDAALARVKVAPMPPMPDLMDTIAGSKIHKRLEYIKCYFVYVSNTADILTSDLVDIMHLFYTPDVDLMRCDRRMHKIFEACPYLATKKLVPRLRDLRDRIEKFEQAEP